MPEHQRAALALAGASQFTQVREDTLRLAAPLSDADATIQSMEDASPAKWHLGHTTWFFETFVLTPHYEDYQVFDPHYNFLFNSYYETIGKRQPRPQRGMLSRPSLDEVLAYRAHVDAAVADLLTQQEPPTDLITLGLHHEQQHQELFLTDLLHAFAQNPIKPAYRAPQPLPVVDLDLDDGWTSHQGGVVTVGADAGGFHFDCEGPAHDALLRPYKIKNRAVTNGEWKAFIADGGYKDPLLWLSDGWATCVREGWEAPLYWSHTDGTWFSSTLRGWQHVPDDAPVCHISFYEADAFARWAGYRLPTEVEWEALARITPVSTDGLIGDRLRPAPQIGDHDGPKGLYGDVWEWTASAYLPYPGFQSADGAIGEYNGKFMSGQMVLRGGSCVTPHGHIRPSYRNFFHPDKRWQFSGLRLAADA